MSLKVKFVKCFCTYKNEILHTFQNDYDSQYLNAMILASFFYLPVP